MSRKFTWQAAGLNEARFRAYSTLLRIKTGGQVGERLKPEPNPEAHNEDDINRNDFCDTSSVSVDTISSFDEAQLKNAFQDRIAELISHSKGGRYVTATLLEERLDSVTVVVAKNNGLNLAEKKFLRKLQELLRSVAKAPMSDGHPRDALWKAVLEYSEVRLSDWIQDLREVAQKIPSLWSQDFQGSQTTNVLKDQIATLMNMLDKPARAGMVINAYAIWNNFREEDFIELCNGNDGQAGRLRLSIGFLGRLHTGFIVLVRAVERLDKFHELRFTPVTSINANPGRVGKIWSLAQAFESLGLKSDDVTVKRVFGPKWTLSGLTNKFDKMQPQACQIHAEVQLVVYIGQTVPHQVKYSDYIGCSKRSCYICWEFLGAYGSQRTRATHGKIFDPWTVPEIQSLPVGNWKRLVRALRAVEDEIKSCTNSSRVEKIQLVKESTVGGSCIATQIQLPSLPSAKFVLNYLAKQRREASEPKVQKPTPEEPYCLDIPGTYESMQGVQDVPVETKNGLCECCEERTGKRCPLCGRGWYCSTACAQESTDHRFMCSGQSITSADYLMKAVLQDQIPDDPQTLEDYGFIRCRTWAMKSHLLGLYGGLIKTERASSTDLHTWRCEGTLVENIVAAYSSIPERFRGGYYPWFLRNKTIVQPGPADAEEPDQVSNPYIDAIIKALYVLSPLDRARNLGELQRIEKLDAFLLFALSREHMSPNPADPADIWYRFGFCACESRHEENQLGAMYSKLLHGHKFRVDYNKSLGISSSKIPTIPTASFEEFWKAYRAGTLISLMDKYGLGQERRSFPQLAHFFASHRSVHRPGIWRLRHYLAFEPTDPTVPCEAQSGAKHFGFSSTLNARTNIELRGVYARLLANAPPLEIELARNEHRLLEYIREKLYSLDAGVEQTLRQLQ